ncbi:MAG: putative lipoprotein YerB precursor [Actinomycetota bacterium]
MRHSTVTKNKPASRAVVASALLVALVASGLGLVSPATALPSAPKSFSTSPDVVPGESGVVAVKVPAHQKGAYPLKGLKAAALIYVAPVERGFTRHIALYGTDKVPEVVGPVRSLRETDFPVLDQFGKVRVYASGRSLERDIMLNLLSRTKHILRVNSNENLREMYFAPGCVDPFCDFLKGTKIAGRGTGLSMSNANILKEAGLSTGALPASVKSTGRSIKSMKIIYRKTPYNDPIPRTIIWNASKKVWIYEASGRSSTIDVVGGKSVAGQTSSASAIIQFTTAKNAGSAFTCRIMPEGGPDAVPYTNSVGKGLGFLLRDGKIYDITWSRSSSTATTSYKFKNGSKVKVTGQPWIYLVPTNLTTGSVTYANGAKVAFAPKPSTPKWSFSTNVLKERKSCEAPTAIKVSKASATSTIIKVTSNFDTLNYVPVKGVKVKVKITGKGYVTLTTSAAGTVTVKAASSKVTSATIAKQTVAGQKYAAKSWKK